MKPGKFRKTTNHLGQALIFLVDFDMISSVMVMRETVTWPIRQAASRREWEPGKIQVKGIPKPQEEQSRVDSVKPAIKVRRTPSGSSRVEPRE